MKVATVVVALCLLSEACSGSPMPTPGAPASATASPSSRLVVLGDGPAGERGLWSFEAPNTWSEAASLPGATGIARFGDSVAISSGGSVELRSAATPAAPGPALPLRWQGPSAAAQIVSLARAPGGKVAIAASDGESQSFWLVAADGVLEPLKPAPAQAFTPRVAWLDDSRLLVLTTDAAQVSRLAVIDVSALTIEPAMTLAGVRVFALSPDRRSLAAATGTGVYAGPVEAFLATGEPGLVAAVDSAAVMWGLAFDDSGTRLAMFSGNVTPGGLVSSARAIGYRRQAESWVMEFDSAVPLGRALDQVWLP
ncbi:MAG: hypothetical protein ACXWN4_03165 [Candidatus Limnocylindrales bacterium]